METFVGLDVSLGETSVCILDKDGTRIFDGKVASEPAPIARLIRKRAGVIRPSVPEAASVSLKASRAPRTLAARALSGIAWPIFMEPRGSASRLSAADAFEG